MIQGCKRDLRFLLGIRPEESEGVGASGRFLSGRSYDKQTIENKDTNTMVFKSEHFPHCLAGTQLQAMFIRILLEIHNFILLITGTKLKLVHN